jgi:hypothetical protein
MREIDSQECVIEIRGGGFRESADKSVQEYPEQRANQERREKVDHSVDIWDAG